MDANSETRLHLIEGLHFAGTTPSGHTIDLDSNLDGTSGAPTPMELQLVTLGGCTGMDTISILRKMRQEITAYDIRLTAERAQEHPRVYTAIVLTHELRGRSISEAKVRRAIELTMTRYCPVFAMLHPTADIREPYVFTDDDTGVVVRGEVAISGAETPPRQES